MYTKRDNDSIVISGLTIFTNYGNMFECKNISNNDTNSDLTYYDIMPPNDCWTWNWLYVRSNNHTIYSMLFVFTPQYCCDGCNNILGNCDGIFSQSFEDSFYFFFFSFCNLGP